MSYEKAMDILGEIPGVSEFLNSSSVIIGNMIIARRKQLGYTEEQLAELSQTTVEQIMSIQFGAEQASADVLDRVFHVLKINSLVPIYDEEAAAYAM